MVRNGLSTNSSDTDVICHMSKMEEVDGIIIRTLKSVGWQVLL